MWTFIKDHDKIYEILKICALLLKIIILLLILSLAIIYFFDFY